MAGVAIQDRLIVSIGEIIGLVVTAGIMLVGVAGSLVPMVPSTPLVFLAALAHRLIFGEQSVSLAVLLLMGGVLAASLGLDYLASAVGARRFGGTWKGMLGALLGLMVGVFFSLPGMILGPFVGAVMGELCGGRRIEEASRAGLGAILGLLAGALGRFVAGLAMTGVFVVDVILRSGG